MKLTYRTYRTLTALFIAALMLIFVAARGAPVAAQMDGALILRPHR